MNSLVNYGSDDDDSSDEKPMDSYSGGRNYRKPGISRQDDANYDEVQMSLSEESGEESSSKASSQSRRQPSPKESARRWDVREGQKSREDARGQKERYPAKSERDDERSRARDSSRERYRSDKEEDRLREKRDERRGKSRERYNRDDKYRDRRDRDRRRSRSPRERERRRSRSPRRERSRSRERGGRGSYSKRYDRVNKERLERGEPQKEEEKTDTSKDRFFMPGITGRFREQIEKRKLLWQKKEPETTPQVQGLASQQQNGAIAGGSRTTKVWEATTFAQDADGKVANKFKRLMGIKNAGEGGGSATDVLKKQEEMFSSMEQQYEVARTATHTMRGVGLGFGSYQR